MSDIVHFSNAPEVFAMAEYLFSVVTARLRAILPHAEILHVGSTAIPGTLTKGDLDIEVRVSSDEFHEADRLLDELFDRNTGSFRSDEFSAFHDSTSNPELGVQLVVVGSVPDNFLAWRHLLECDAELRREYDNLKKRFEGQSMESYRAAKAQFIETHIGG